jgi:predicted nucleic acid-binding protein
VSSERFLLDTFFALALLNPRDEFHADARAVFPRVRTAGQIVVTEAVLTEIANYFGDGNRRAAVDFIEQLISQPNVHVVNVDSSLFRTSLDLYKERPDKHWGLTDCISFVVMERLSLTDALTGDHHFEQAGFRTLFPLTT